MQRFGKITACFFLFFGIFSASAQETRGAIQGRVMDSTGGGIPGAQVKAVNTATRVELNIELEVGQATESIEVKGDAPLLDTASASLGQVVDQRRILDLPTFGG